MTSIRKAKKEYKKSFKRQIKLASLMVNSYINELEYYKTHNTQLEVLVTGKLLRDNEEINKDKIMKKWNIK